MTCLECHTPLGYLDHRKAIERFGFELCSVHRRRMERLLQQQELPEEAVMLYYALKEIGIHSMLAWWNGKETIDLAISRVKLNISIETEGDAVAHEEILQSLEDSPREYTADGFTHIRIPAILIRRELRRTVEDISAIIFSLKAEVRAI